MCARAMFDIWRETRYGACDRRQMFFDNNACALVMWSEVRVFFLQAYSTTGTERLTAKLFLCNLIRSISCSVSASR